MVKNKKKTCFLVIRISPLEKAYLLRESKKYKPLGKFSEFIRKALGL